MVEKPNRLLVLCLLMALLILPFIAGCSGVWMNAEYSTLLDKTTALSTETALRAKDGVLTTEQMTVALLKQAETWQKFKAAKDGKVGEIK